MKYYLQCHLFQLHSMARKVSRIMEEITVKDMGDEERKNWCFHNAGGTRWKHTKEKRQFPI